LKALVEEIDNKTEKKVKRLWRKANTLYMQENFIKESKIREKICKLVPKNAQARHNFALSLSLAGEFVRAEEQFIIALQLDSTDSRSHNNYANILFFFRKDENSAVKHYLDAIYYSKDANEFSRHFHNYCIVLSLGSHNDNKEKIEWLSNNVLDKKFGGKFRKKNLKFHKELITVYVDINQAKLFWIENKWDGAINMLKKASIKCANLGLHGRSKGIMSISEDVLLTKEIASVVEKLSIDLDITMFRQKIIDLKEKIDKLLVSKIKYKVSYSNGVCFGVVVIHDLLKAIKLFCVSILSSLEYFTSKGKFSNVILNNVQMIHKLTANNFSYFGRQLSWVLDSLGNIISMCDRELDTIASKDLQLKTKNQYWLLFSKSLSNYKMDVSQLGKEVPIYREISFEDPLVTKLYQVELQDSLPSQVTSSIKMANHLFRHLTGIPIYFNESIESISELHKPCHSHIDFRIKIGALAQLFDISLSSLRKIVKNPENQWKSIKLLEVWFHQNALEYDANMLQIWRNIIDLRNSSFPYHPSTSRLILILNFFGSSFPIDYPKLWILILRRFLESIESFQEILSGLMFK